MTKRILVAVDGSEEAAEALRFAAEEWPDADLTALHVINPADSTTGAEGGFPGAVDQWYDSAKKRGERILADATDRIDREVATRLEVGRPTTTILDVAAGEESPEGGDAEPFDHVVLASRGRTGLSRVVLGSVAEGVVRRAEVPVTVVR
ncbi:Nucleotide-binding universal stress protein, UspA family [Halorubrum aquaticum]|uniref:Nucleotide-binding universal stress protein, UspA family n=1 Tax=Halorubrum aquaticum TaxID=387340 RepID=A0A1I2ZIM7_9EURY|nr:universal stress protein [Halorubrum aquaticum]SFH37673.1 Nucleotide-binding universal stress protein, UspA family [Halorubrum aquaticum]